MFSKILIAVAVSFSLAFATDAGACAMKPPPMPLEQLRKTSDAIVTGRLDYGFQPFVRTNGKIVYTVGQVIPARILKGPRNVRFRINHEHMNTACQTWGWEPQRKPVRQYAGTFYLFANKDGTYSIARYEAAGR
jgi:hypothetical protein